MSDDAMLATLLIGGPFAIGLTVLFYLDYRRNKFSRSPEGMALAEKRKRESDEKQQKDQEKQRENERKEQKWAEAHPRLDALYKGLFSGLATVVCFWLANKQWKHEWWEWFWGFFGSVYALATVWFLLSSIFTFQGAFTLLFWLIGGSIFLGLSAWALQSTQGTIILGFVILIGVILYGVKAIKDEIRKRT